MADISAKYMRKFSTQSADDISDLITTSMLLNITIAVETTEGTDDVTLHLSDDMNQSATTDL